MKKKSRIVKRAVIRASNKRFIKSFFTGINNAWSWKDFPKLEGIDLTGPAPIIHFPWDSK